MLLLLLACTGPDDTAAPAPDPLSWAVTAPGLYQAGHRAWTITYTPPDGSGERSVDLDLWYPTEDQDGREASYDDLVDDPLAFEDATMAPPVHDGGYPVHVYSHGNQGFGGTSAFLARHLASHGWVTIAPGHTGNRLQDYIDPKPTSIYIHRATDVSAALDALATEVPEADVSRVVLSGHSFGNYTCWAAGGATLDVPGIEQLCAEGGTNSGECTEGEIEAFRQGIDDPRVIATVHLAGTLDRRWFGDTGHRGMTGPVMFMSGTNDQVGQQAQWDAIDGLDYTWLELEGGCHQTFALGSCSTLEADKGFHVVQSYALAFARVALLDDDDTQVIGILDGSVPIDPIVTFQRKTE
ncbi:MAG: hypothetical protein H6739_18500 [Alphaproteobacteria bacterium]|nr:hypothetical protein [Alphaproteobacteria bacterium]